MIYVITSGGPEPNVYYIKSNLSKKDILNIILVKNEKENIDFPNSIELREEYGYYKLLFYTEKATWVNTKPHHLSYFIDFIDLGDDTWGGKKYNDIDWSSKIDVLQFEEGDSIFIPNIALIKQLNKNILLEIRKHTKYKQYYRHILYSLNKG